MTRSFPSIANLSNEALCDLFELPQKEAAAKLDSYEGALIRLCRSRGYSKWPYRQLAAITQKIKRLEAILAENPGSSMPLIQALIEQHQAEYQAIKTRKPDFKNLKLATKNDEKAVEQVTPSKMSLDFVLCSAT
ncbi:hypothetical protein SDRG_03433 [Saprolegnia diclina VS20]|uniref:RWP-RK domain-containing protein n=1 Tax=Saprolegnia diclina (strain VS20) TaxID=1156394 RepID=T0S2L7_SAPDV|nr:hypothetical protein SDRG_03433 [Saprolegnia diclina VS20]EQC39228.1 hypothetical protein SDRG_03433 [Saprolegnia diclina VS20]|eukprot:XP_008607289.1 hypothetical protein SDRG_03433 [Saprolegnia diclina VS20]